MSTPTFNSVPTTEFVPAAGNDGALQYDVKWGGPYGTGVALTYSFPKGYAWWSTGYLEFEDGWYELNAPERDAVESALAQWAAVANITFTRVNDGEFLVGDLRFAGTDAVSADAAAHAYLPWSTPDAGDVWFKNGEWHENPGSKIKKGSYDYLTILHEIGHAIGLEHSFEPPQKIGRAFDSYAFTIMSYSATPGSDDNYASFYPTTPMYYDLVNIQGMYGRGVHSPGNTTYRYKDGKNFWETIDDSGGIDTIVHKGSDKALIDLNIGHWSDLGRSIQFSSGSTKSTVMIGPDTLIENATGGVGKDRIIGNAAANILAGREGKDKINGGGGADGFLFDVKLTRANLDTIRDFSVGQDTIRLAHKVFGGLGVGAVSAEEFAAHFDYAGGVLEYKGKPVAKLIGAPAIDADDLLVV